MRRTAAEKKQLPEHPNNPQILNEKPPKPAINEKVVQK